MLQTISRFYKQHLQSKSNATEADTGKQLQLACAALLIEIAVIDSHQSDEETEKLTSLLQQNFGLSTEDVAKLWQLARDEVKQASSFYQFTSLINANYSYQQKCELLQHLWEIAFADGRIDRYEEHMIRRFCDLLHLSHGDFIRAKVMVKEKLQQA